MAATKKKRTTPSVSDPKKKDNYGVDGQSMQSRAPPSIRRHARHTCPSRTLSAAAAAASIGSSSNPVSLLRNELLICAGNWMRPMMAKKNSGQSKVSRAPFKAATNQSGTLGSLCADVVIFHQPQRRNSALGLGPSKATRETEKNLVKLHHAASAREREREAEKSLGDDDTKASSFLFLGCDDPISRNLHRPSTPSSTNGRAFHGGASNSNNNTLGPKGIPRAVQMDAQIT